MDDATAILAGQTKKYSIPLSHFEHKYIQNCTDGKELERIYKELTGGEIGSFPDLEKLTLDRIQQIKPNSHTLRQDKAPLDRAALPDDEREQFTDFLNQMKAPATTAKDHQNNGVKAQPIRSKTAVKSKPNPPVSSAPVISKTDKPKRIVPRGYDEWGKLEKKISQQVSSDDEDKPPVQPSKPAYEKKQRLRMAEEHRQSGNNAFRSNNYQESINSYSNSIMLDDTNPVVYMNRAIAHFRLNKYDASLSDCSQVLAKEPNHIKALFRRASCCVAKQQYHEAKTDLDRLLSIDPDNNEAKNLLQTIPSIPQTKGVRIPIAEDDGEEKEEAIPIQPTPSVSMKIPIVEVDEEEDEEGEEQEQQVIVHATSSSMNIDIPSKPMNHARPCIDSQEGSPAMLDHYLHQPDEMKRFQDDVRYQLSSLDAEPDTRQGEGNDADNDDDDDMQLGDEADAGLSEHMSDDDGHVSHSFNVSPTPEDDDNEPPELIDQKPLTTPPFSPDTPPTQYREPLDLRRGYQVNHTYNRSDVAARSTDQDMEADLPLWSTSTKHTSPPQRTNKNNTNGGNISQPTRSSATDVHQDQVSTSNFGSTIQSWLRDTVQLETDRRPSSHHTRPWSKSVRPWSLDKLQRDIERFNRLRDFGYAIEASKKMLKNGILDYHNHAEHITSALVLCAQCYSNVNKHCSTVQYTSEALQYNRMDSNILICRAKAFEKENFLLFSYADYARIPPSDHCYSTAQRACETLAEELDTSEGKNWRARLPTDTNDDERYFTYLKAKVTPDENLYDWYRKRANQLYIDACYILAIRCYTHCIELQPEQHLSYLNRSACYLKVFEPQRAIDDCDQVLEIVPNNPRALYRKACAYKMNGSQQLYALTLKDLIKLQPKNQVVLAEFYASRQEAIPRRMRRLRTNGTATSTSVTVPNPSSTTAPLTAVIEETLLSYEQLEVLRTQKAHTLSTNVSYQFTQQLEALKLTDIEGQCVLMLRVPTKGLFKFASAASPKLVETIIRVCRTMVHAEKRFQQEHKSRIAPFSYIQFCFQLLVQVTTLPRIESALMMIDVDHRASLDDLLAYYSSISSTLTDVEKLNRLRK